MKNIVHISLALAATAFTLVGAFFVEPPPAAARAGSQDLATASSSFDQDRFAATGELLCGLTLGDVADIIDYYDFDPDMQTLAGALSTPFDCSAYGELCLEIDETDAYDVVCGTWSDMRAAAPLPVLLANIRVRLDEVGIGVCEPSPWNCQQACGEGNPVLDCTGMRLNGRCIPTPDCMYPPEHGIGIEIIDRVVEQ